MRTQSVAGWHGLAEKLRVLCGPGRPRGRPRAVFGSCFGDHGAHPKPRRRTGFAALCQSPASLTLRPQYRYSVLRLYTAAPSHDVVFPSTLVIRRSGGGGRRGSHVWWGAQTRSARRVCQPGIGARSVQSRTKSFRRQWACLAIAILPTMLSVGGWGWGGIAHWPGDVGVAASLGTGKPSPTDVPSKSGPTLQPAASPTHEANFCCCTPPQRDCILTASFHRARPCVTGIRGPCPN